MKNSFSFKAFFTVLAVASFLLWLGGYNFDSRHPAVAGLALFALYAASWFGLNMDAFSERKYVE
jgi:hypothetical protein